MSATRNQTAEIAVLFSAEERTTELREEVRLGLTSRPKELQPKWFYDERGSELFDAITRLPEYYLTRAERSILERHAGEIAAMTDATTLIELGSGTSDKTRILLDALAPRRFVPFDVSEETLRASAESLAREYPTLKVVAVVGDFEYHLPLLPANGRRLLAFLGSTIGNLPPTQRARFLNDIAATLGDGDTFLLGVDLVKSPARLVAAYDDPGGVTSEFNLNVLRVLNRELCGDFDVSAFEHVAHWNAEAEWMEMFVRSLREQTVRLEALELEVAFDAGELMRTEISAKFHLRRLANELEAAGLAVQRWWTDEAGDFAVLLAWATQGGDRSDRDSRWPLPERHERRLGHSSIATSRAISSPSTPTTTTKRTPSASRASANSGFADPEQRWPTPSSTRPAYATSRSHLRPSRSSARPPARLGRQQSHRPSSTSCCATRRWSPATPAREVTLGYPSCGQVVGC